MRGTGRRATPHGRAIVWQDRRTAERCEELQALGALDLVRERTGLVLDPYFSSTKIEWLLRHGGVKIAESLALGTIDAWIAVEPHRRCGLCHGSDQRQPHDALRHPPAYMGSRALRPVRRTLDHLPDVKPSSGRFGETSDRCGVPAGLPVSGIAGDQQAALFGQACFQPGMAKNTYGTGSFVLLNVGPEVPEPAQGMLTSVAWELATGEIAYALEGAVFVTGAAIQWLRDGLGVIDNAADIGPLAESVDSSDGVVIVPAFTGLGSPWWDPYARGTVIGITRGTTRAHLARAVVESIAFQARDVVDAMTSASGVSLADLRVDGGASAMDLLLQLQADQLGVAVRRPADQETTALGAAFLAGLAEGIWPNLDAIAERWTLDASFEPRADRTVAEAMHATGRGRWIGRATGRGPDAFGYGFSPVSA